MKYIDQKSKTVYEDIEVEVPDGITYFKTTDGDGNEFYYKLNITPDPRFNTFYNIAITKMQNYDCDYFIKWWEVLEAELPYNIRGYFSGESERWQITEEEFNRVKQEILNKL